MTVGQPRLYIDNELVYEKSDNEDSPITADSQGSEYDDIANQFNVANNDTNDYLAAELNDIIDHRYLAVILEFKVE